MLTMRMESRAIGLNFNAAGILASVDRDCRIYLFWRFLCVDFS